MIKLNSNLCLKSEFEESDVKDIKSDIITGVPHDGYLITNLGSIIDQGFQDSCSAIVAITALDFYNEIRKKKSKISINNIYKLRKNKDIDGMSIKESLQILKNKKHINSFGRITQLDELKHLIMSKGPICIGLPLKNYSDSFWMGEEQIGYHAVCLIGWTEKGYIIRNSWGKERGKNGCHLLRNEDVGSIIEAWCIID